eukprot:scaffold7811_cov92-Cylindrotheca_fusiformis.AAC.6
MAAFDTTAHLKGQEIAGTGEVARGRKCNGRGGAFSLSVCDGRVVMNFTIATRIQWGHAGPHQN